MTEPFAAKLDYVLKVLSLSRGGLAAQLGVNKSMVGRWVSGGARPSAYNLARLADRVARRFPSFTVLDWERPISSLAALFGADPDTVPGVAHYQPTDMLRLPLLEFCRATTNLRGSAYEGLFRTTRPFFQSPGEFIHDHVLIQRDSGGLLRFTMVNAGVRVEGWILLLHNQCFMISAEVTSGTFAFGIFNAVNTVQAGRLDGLILISALDPSRTPVASTVLLERVADLTGDASIDEAAFAELCRQPAPAPRGSVPKDVADHLARDIGPAALALGGDWLLSMPPARSLSRGADQPG